MISNNHNPDIVREYPEHTAKSAIQAACNDFPDFTSCSKSSPSEPHNFVLYDVDGETIGFLYITTKADVKKGWADKSALGSRLLVKTIKRIP